MSGIYVDCGQVADLYRLVGCQHAKHHLEAHPGLGIFTALATARGEWTLIVKPARLIAFIECGQCNHYPTQ